MNDSKKVLKNKIGDSYGDIEDVALNFQAIAKLMMSLSRYMISSKKEDAISRVFKCCQEARQASVLFDRSINDLARIIKHNLKSTNS